MEAAVEAAVEAAEAAGEVAVVRDGEVVVRAGGGAARGARAAGAVAAE